MTLKSVIFSILLFTCSLAATAQGIGLKIGYTNVEYILSQMPGAKAADAELKSYGKQLENQVKAKEQELKTKLEAYQKGEATMTDLVKNDKQAELQSLSQRLEGFRREAQASLEKKQKKLFEPLFDKIGKAVKAVRKANGYDMIFSTGAPGVDILLDADEKYDVSNLVFKQLGITPPTPLGNK